MKSLDEFRGHRQLFTDAKTLPPFFETNLVDPARVVKYFGNDPQAEIRIFYYQYLKLCFELENVNYDLYIHKIEEIINNPDFQFIFYSNDDQSIFNDTQAKSLIMEFFGVLGDGKLSVLQALTNYPILDKIFIHFFRSLLILSNVTDSLDGYINRDDILDFLCKTFEVDAEIHGECIRYTETDIFIYELNPQAVYMAYMDYELNNNVQDGQEYANLPVQQPKYDVAEQRGAVLTSYNAPQPEIIPQPQRDARNRSLLTKDSYIASEFLDFTSNIETLTAKANITQEESAIDRPVVAQIKKTNFNPTPQPVVIKPDPKPVVTVPVVPVVAKDVKVIKETQKQQLPIQNFNNILEVQSIGSTSKQTESRSEIIKSEVIKTDNWQSSSPVKVQQQPQQLNGYQNNFYTSNDINKYNSQTVWLDKSSPQIQVPPIAKTQAQPVPLKITFSPTKDNSIYQSSQVNTYKQQPNKDIFYNPKIENPSFNVGTFASSKVQQITKEVKTTTVNGAGKKKIFGLNVSDEFTSPDVSKLMAQPHRSNVESMKNRARNFRSSLMSYVK